MDSMLNCNESVATAIFTVAKKAVTHVHSSYAFIKKADLKTYSTYSASILLQLCT